MLLFFIISLLNFAIQTKEDDHYGKNEILPSGNFNTNFDFQSECLSKCLDYRRIGFYSVKNEKCIIWSHSSYKEQKTEMLLNSTICDNSKGRYWCATDTYKLQLVTWDWDYCKVVDCDVVRIEPNCVDAIKMVSTSSLIKMNSKLFCKVQNCLIVLYTMNKCFFTIKCLSNCQQFSNFKTSFFPSCISLTGLHERDDTIILSPLPENTLYEIYILPIIDLKTMGSTTRMFIKTQPLKLPVPNQMTLASRTSSTIEVKWSMKENIDPNIYRFVIKSLMNDGKFNMKKDISLYYNLKYCKQYCYVISAYYYTQQYYKSKIYCFYTEPVITSIEKVHVINNFVKWDYDSRHKCSILFEGEYYRESFPEKSYSFSTNNYKIFLYYLVPNTTYLVRVRICLKDGRKCDFYGDFTPWVKFQSSIYTKGINIKVFILVPILFSLLCFIILTYIKRRQIGQIVYGRFPFLRRNNSNHIQSLNLNGNSLNTKKSEEFELSLKKEQDIPVTNDQKLNCQNIANYYENQTINNYDHLKEEYESIGQKSKQYQKLCNYTLNTGKMDNNLKKNRFTNIVPYDHSRVILKGRSETDNYINASYIPYEKNDNKVEYIAAQGPTSTTVDDFWKMIWDENISLIIMLTECYEKEIFKCIQYWPTDINTFCEYVSDLQLNVLLQEENITKKYTERKLHVRNKDTKEERVIIHMQMVTWNDYSTPNMIFFEEFLFHFHKLCNDGVKNPYLFHCSAGVGRTGTFTVIDRIIRKLVAGSQEIDVVNEVLELRKYRVQMVQREAQYIFIHEFIKYFIDKYMKPGPQPQEMIYSND